MKSLATSKKVKFDLHDNNCLQFNKYRLYHAIAMYEEMKKCEPLVGMDMTDEEKVVTLFNLYGR